MTVQHVACGETFTLPSTAAEADTVVDSLGVLATATEWKRAAIIHTRVTVRDRRGRPNGQKLTNDLLTPDEYAALGIHGLRSATTVRRYCRAWQKAIDDGLTVPGCWGGTVKLPTADWADYYLPDIPDPDPDSGESSNRLGTLLAGDLLRVLAVKAFAATDRDNPLTAVKFEATSSQLIAVATDRFALAARWCDYTGEPFEALVQLDHIEQLAKMTKNAGIHNFGLCEVTIRIDDDSLEFVFSDGTLKVRASSEEFPDWRKMFIGLEEAEAVNPDILFDLSPLARFTGIGRNMQLLPGRKPAVVVDVDDPDFIGLIMPTPPNGFVWEPPAWLGL
jgi:hypothetical protein